MAAGYQPMAHFGVEVRSVMWPGLTCMISWKRGASTAFWGVTPLKNSGTPSRSTIAGRMEWHGRWPAWLENSLPRLLSTTPGVTRHQHRTERTPGAGDRGCAQLLDPFGAVPLGRHVERRSERLLIAKFANQ